MGDLIKIEQCKIGENKVNAVNARDVWEYLESKQQFGNWIINRIDKIGFKENLDFLVINKLINDDSSFSGQRKIKEYIITVKMAKKLGMMENTKKGDEVRDYFIAIEEKYNEQNKEFEIPKTFSQALRLAADLQEQKEKLLIENKELSKTIIKQKPLVDFANDVRISNNSIDIGTFSKILNIKNMGMYNLFEYFRDEGYLIPDGDKKNLPYEKYMINNGSGYFEVIEKVRTVIINNKKEKIVYPQTLITGKGQLYFQKLLKQNDTTELTLFNEEELKK